MRQFLSANFRLVAISMLLAACNQAVGAAQPHWPQSPSRLDLPTPYGTLGIKTSEYVYESRLLLNSTDISPKVEGILNIAYAFALPNAQAALVSINDGNNVCPISYRWVIMYSKGYSVSPAFGSCSDQIRVSVTGKKFTLQTPNNKKPDKIDVYVYDGKTIKQRTASK